NGLARGERAPRHDGAFGFLDVLEKGNLAVEAAPAAGLEHLGQMLEPLFGECAPACCDIAAPSRFVAVCPEPARWKKHGWDATHTNQLDVTRIFCGKVRTCPATTRPVSQTTVVTRGFSVRLPSSHSGAWPACNATPARHAPASRGIVRW